MIINETCIIQRHCNNATLRGSARGYQRRKGKLPAVKLYPVDEAIRRLGEI